MVRIDDRRGRGLAAYFAQSVAALHADDLGSFDFGRRDDACDCYTRGLVGEPV